MTDYRKLLFNIDIAGNPPAEGSLLVAEPFLHEQYFNHAVICLIEYQPKESAMGVVLNRQSRYTLSEVLDKVDSGLDIPVYCGGPVGVDHLYYLHTMDELIPGGRQIVDGLWVGGDLDAMLDYVNSGMPLEGRIRFFVGYSGWSAGQLEDELERNVWAVTDIAKPGELLEGDEDAVWHREIRRMGEPYRGWLFHPMNPLSN